jgi:hypothetical protein
LYRLRTARPFSLKADVSAVVDLGEVVLTATVAIPGKIEVVPSQPIYLLNNPNRHVSLAPNSGHELSERGEVLGNIVLDIG